MIIIPPGEFILGKMLRTCGKSLDTQDVYHYLAHHSKELEITSVSIGQGLITLSMLKP